MQRRKRKKRKRRKRRKRNRRNKEKEEQEGKFCKSRNEKDISRKSGKKRDDNAYSESIPRAEPPLEEEFAGLQIDFSKNEPQHTAGQGMQSTRKDKEKMEDWSDWWSEEVWNQGHNGYFRSRQNSLGECEYEYGPILEEGGNQTDVC
jgi:hypothetical protein